MTSGAATSRRRGLPSQPKTSWDETSQPQSTPAMTSGVETSRLHNPELSGTRRPSPYPQHQLLRGWRRLVAAASPRNPKLSGTRRPSPHPDPQSPRGWRRPVSTPPTPSQPRTFWDETSQPPSRPAMTSGAATSRRRGLPRNLGRDVPAPTRSINYFGVGDVPSPKLPCPHNARHQSGTSPALRQPAFKTLKGFQTVAGGKAARPPPPVPRPQNVQPPPLAEGVGGGGIPEPPQAVSPDESRSSAIPRRRKKAHRESLPRANVLCAGQGPARPRPVLRPSACSAGLCSLMRSLKAELRRAEPRKDALRVTKQRRDRGFHGFRG